MSIENISLNKFFATHLFGTFDHFILLSVENLSTEFRFGGNAFYLPFRIVSINAFVELSIFLQPSSIRSWKEPSCLSNCKMPIQQKMLGMI